MTATRCPDRVRAAATEVQAEIDDVEAEVEAEHRDELDALELEWAEIVAEGEALEVEMQARGENLRAKIEAWKERAIPTWQAMMEVLHERSPDLACCNASQRSSSTSHLAKAGWQSCLGLIARSPALRAVYASSTACSRYRPCADRLAPRRSCSRCDRASACRRQRYPPLRAMRAVIPRLNAMVAVPVGGEDFFRYLR